MVELALTKANQGQSFEVRQGETVLIRLEANPTTGYAWAVDEISKEILTLAPERFLAPESTLLGAPGVQEIRFRAVSLGTTRIRLKYWQAWEGDASVRDRYEVRVTVRDK